MTFSIVEGNIKNIKEPVKYIEVQNINSASIINFKNSVGNSNLFSQFDLSLAANPNDNYNILSSILEQAKNEHIPKKIQRLNRRKHFIAPWMNRELLTLINKKKMINIEIGSQPIMILNMKLKKLTSKLLREL